MDAINTSTMRYIQLPSRATQFGNIVDKRIYVDPGQWIYAKHSQHILSAICAGYNDNRINKMMSTI